MSRLIDADILELDAEWNEYEDGFISYSKMQIDNAETVKAIPMEVMEQILEEYKLRIPPTVYYDLLADVRNYEVGE